MTRQDVRAAALIINGVLAAWLLHGEWRDFWRAA